MFGRKKHGNVFTTQKRSQRIKYHRERYDGRDIYYAAPAGVKAGKKRGDERRWSDMMHRKYGGE